MGIRDSARQLFYSFGKAQTRNFAHKADDITMSATAKAMEEPLIPNYGERWRLFTMEGTKPRELASTPLQTHLLPHDVRQGNSGANLVKELWVKGHGSL